MLKYIFAKLKLHKQMSDSQCVMIFITMSGGLQDAYTYWMRDGVFANAQTGNIVLLTGYLFQRRWAMVGRYLIPVLAFSLGIIIAEQIRGRFKDCERIHWRQIVLLLEIIFLMMSAFIPASINICANALISSACAMQVESFRKVNGYGYASTMCIGNLRGAMSALSHWTRTRESEHLATSIQYLEVIACFGIGAILGTVLPIFFHLKTICLSSFLLLIAFFIMFL